MCILECCLYQLNFFSFSLCYTIEYTLNKPNCFKRTELYGRPQIRTSKRISNPGCYATSSQLLIAPLLNCLKLTPSSSNNDIEEALPTVFGMSGYSGAGTVAGATDPDGRPTTVAKVDPASLRGVPKPYALTDHIHEREAGTHLTSLFSSSSSASTSLLKRVKVAFIPSVGPWFSGIISTLSAPLNTNTSAKKIRELYEAMYGGEKLIKVQAGVPSLADVENRQGWVVGGFQVHSEGDRVVVVVRRRRFCSCLLNGG